MSGSLECRHAVAACFRHEYAGGVKTPKTKSDLQPWARGPFELLKHAYGHFKDGADTDRRIALIGFDNTVEVCIESYVNLNDAIRGGISVPRKEREAVLTNFYTKLKFLEGHVQKVGITLAVPVAHIA